MPKVKSKVEEIEIVRNESHFDRACDWAYRSAISRFGIDEAGHARDANFPRHNSELKVKFKSYTHSGSMGGQEHLYIFEAWMERYDEDEDADDDDLNDDNDDIDNADDDDKEEYL